MLALVLGGAASGKSEYAEQLAVSLASEHYYIATMEVSDAESKKRVKRHQLMRQNKGFITVEHTLNLPELVISKRTGQASALLECASTLLGNELYMPGGARHNGWLSIYNGVQNLLVQGLELVVVSNNVFESGETYSTEMQEYLQQLGKLNFQLARLADLVIEVCYGIPLYHKNV